MLSSTKSEAFRPEDAAALLLDVVMNMHGHFGNGMCCGVLGCLCEARSL